MNNGRWVIVGILSVGLIAAGFAWWYQRQQGSRALAYWGARQAWLIRHAPHVALLTLTAPNSERNGAPPADTDADDARRGDAPLMLDGAACRIVSRQDITAARGLVHARQALIQDASYDWDAAAPEIPPEWDYALVFTDRDATPEKSLTVLLDLDRQWIRSGDGPTVRRLTIAPGMRRFIDDLISPPPGSVQLGEPGDDVGHSHPAQHAE